MSLFFIYFPSKITLKINTDYMIIIMILMFIIILIKLLLRLLLLLLLLQVQLHLLLKIIGGEEAKEVEDIF